MRKFKLFLVFIGLLVLCIDIYLTHRGTSLCPFEGCRVVVGTPFSKIWGVSLNYWGIAFFVVSLFSLLADYLFAYWVSIGAGFSLYLIFLQVVVIEKICQLCLFIELVVFIMFLASLKSNYLKKMLLFVIIGFFITHAFYTFPPPYKDKKIADIATWKGDGELTIDFFFDPDCPGCEKVFERLYKEKGLIKSITFRCVPVHKGSFVKGIEFYKLCRKLENPWEAFKIVHKKNQVGGFLSHISPYKIFLKENLELINFLNSDAVPTIVVRDNGFMRVIVGYAQFARWLDEKKKEKVPETEEFFAPIGGVCTPKRCE